MFYVIATRSGQMMSSWETYADAYSAACELNAEGDDRYEVVTAAEYLGEEA